MDMSPPHSYYDRLDDAALAIGLGLVLLGLVAMGVLETLIGSAHFTERVAGVGVIIVHTSFTPDLRAYIIALGFLVLLAWGVSRVARAIIASIRSDP